MAAVIDRGDYGYVSPGGPYDAARERVLILYAYRVELEIPLGAGGAAVRGVAPTNRADGEPRSYLTVWLPAS